MPLQKQVNFLRQFPTNSFGGRDLVNSCLAQAIHGAEPSQQKIFPVLAYPRAIVQNALVDSLFHEQLVICVGKPVRLIADALKQTQRTRIRRELERHRTAGSINLLELFCQTYDGQLVQPEALEFAAGRGKLALAAVDDDQIGQTDGDKPVIPNRV